MLTALRAAARPAMALRSLSTSATCASSELRNRMAELIPAAQVGRPAAPCAQSRGRCALQPFLREGEGERGEGGREEKARQWR